jgi:hypothetical protein
VSKVFFHKRSRMNKTSPNCKIVTHTQISWRDNSAQKIPTHLKELIRDRGSTTMAIVAQKQRWIDTENVSEAATYFFLSFVLSFYPNLLLFKISLLSSLIMNGSHDRLEEQFQFLNISVIHFWIITDLDPFFSSTDLSRQTGAGSICLYWLDALH